MSCSKWQIFQDLSFYDTGLGFGVDISGAGVTASEIRDLEGLANESLREMAELETGGIANKDENRMVGHYWLRAPERSPSEEVRAGIQAMQDQVVSFAADVFAGKLLPASGKPYQNFLLIGIGGSALGPQLLSDALDRQVPGLNFYSLDNTDPVGIERVLQQIPNFAETLFIVISKSGGTKETRNAMLLVEEYCTAKKVPFASQAVAVTGEGSALMKEAVQAGWCQVFPMWDWVGGRTSICSAVGLLPLALLGHDIYEFLRGAASMDEQTRSDKIATNPALLLSLAWYKIGDDGQGNRDMVVLPYKDSLLYFSRYLQQLVMESLGKELSRDGEVVHQGIAVYGNKGSTDQHAYVQQLRDGIDNFFVTFIEVLKDAPSASPLTAFEVEPGVTTGDYLAGFLHGTREALSEKERRSLTITVANIDVATLGMLIALFERAVGFYASFVNINAYHQPGVEAGKRAAANVLGLQQRILAELRSSTKPVTVPEVAERLQVDDCSLIFRIMQRLHANGKVQFQSEGSIYDGKYSIA